MPSRALAIATTSAAVVATLLVPSAPSQAVTREPCLVAAHRGDHARWTENSLNAAKAAMTDGADFVEMDVQVTSDGQFVLMHDRTVNRTTRGSWRGDITGRTYAQVQRMRLNDGERVPSLASVLHALEPSRTGAFVELKWIPARRWPALVEMIRDFGADRVVVNSFSRNVMGKFHARYPQLRSALDANRAIGVADARSFGGVMLDGRKTTAHWRSTMRTSSVPVYLWAADRPSTWRAWSGQVTAVISNHPQGYLAYRKSACRVS